MGKLEGLQPKGLCQFFRRVYAAFGDASNRQCDLHLELFWVQVIERPVCKPHVCFDVARIACRKEFFDLGLVKAHGISLSWADFERDDYDVAVFGAVDLLHTG